MKDWEWLERRVSGEERVIPKAEKPVCKLRQEIMGA